MDRGFQCHREVATAISAPAEPDLATILELMECPDCGCQGEAVPACVRCWGEDGCGERQDHGDCDCPLVPGPPCEHILAADHAIDLETWHQMQVLRWRVEYAERPPPPTPGLVLNRAARVAVMAGRQESGYGLYHPDDLWRSGDEDVGIRPDRAVNGRPTTGTLVTRKIAA